MHLIGAGSDQLSHSLARMPIPASPTLITSKELLDYPNDGYRYELVAGALKMMSPAGGRHGRISLQIAFLLKSHVQEHSLGVVLAAETGFLIETEPDTVLAPDASFVSKAAFEKVENEATYLPLAPELVVEVLSPNDRFSRVESKALAWLSAGTRLVLVVSAENETIHAYRSPKRIAVYARGETIDCNDAVEGWSLSVDEAFRIY